MNIVKKKRNLKSYYIKLYQQGFIVNDISLKIVCQIKQF